MKTTNSIEQLLDHIKVLRLRSRGDLRLSVEVNVSAILSLSFSEGEDPQSVDEMKTILIENFADWLRASGNEPDFVDGASIVDWYYE